MPARTREELIARLEAAHDAGRGVRLCASELRLMLARPEAGEELPLRPVEPVPPPVVSKGQPLDVQVRWLIRRDMVDVLRIERESYSRPWTDDDFLGHLKKRNCIGMVAEHNQTLVGFMVYDFNKGPLHILNFAVDPAFRRRSIGSQMMQRLVCKLSHQRRSELLIHVRETNLDAQLFFKRQGFRAVNVLTNHYDDISEDAIEMRYRIASPERQER